MNEFYRPSVETNNTKLPESGYNSQEEFDNPEEVIKNLKYLKNLVSGI